MQRRRTHGSKNQGQVLKNTADCQNIKPYEIRMLYVKQWFTLFSVSINFWKTTLKTNQNRVGVVKSTQTVKWCDYFVISILNSLT